MSLHDPSASYRTSKKGLSHDLSNMPEAITRWPLLVELQYWLSRLQRVRLPHRPSFIFFFKYEGVKRWSICPEMPHGPPKSGHLYFFIYKNWFWASPQKLWAKPEDYLFCFGGTLEWPLHQVVPPPPSITCDCSCFSLKFNEKVQCISTNYYALNPNPTSKHQRWNWPHFD